MIQQPVAPPCVGIGHAPNQSGHSAALPEGETELPNVERLIWEKDGTLYLCLIWNALRGQHIDGVGVDRSVIDGPPRTITIRLSGPVQDIRNLRTGKSLGSGREFEDTWLPCEANGYQVQP